jgi:hypothetical protein
MDVPAIRRALPELVSPGGIDDLLPSRASDFVTIERLVLEHEGSPAADLILQARRRHLGTGTGPVIVDLPTGHGRAPGIAATRMSMVVDGEPTDRITVDVDRSPLALEAGDVDHWSLDLDHDGLIHRAMVTGDGAPPARIVGDAAVHDTDRRIALRIAARSGLVVSSGTTIAGSNW